MSLPKVKFIGQQGSWLVTVDIPGYGKVKLASAHKEFIKGKDLHYSRTDALGQMVKSHPRKYYEWREALLKHQMVVVTNDKWISETEVQRNGYIAAYKVTDIKISPDDAEHSFKLSARIVDPK